MSKESKKKKKNKKILKTKNIRNFSKNTPILNLVNVIRKFTAVLKYLNISKIPLIKYIRTSMILRTIY